MAEEPVFTERLDSIENRLSRLEGVVEQMGHRLAEMGQRLAGIEQGQRWIMGLIFGVWITLMLAILGPYLKG
jgi:hypothetical protein